MSQRYSVPAHSPLQEDEASETLSVSSTSSFSKTWNISWKFDANLGDLEDSDIVSVDDLDIDLPGRWSFIIKSRPHDPEKKTLQFGLAWEGSSVGALEDRVKTAHHDQTGAWPPTPSGEVTFGAFPLRGIIERHYAGRVDVDVHRSWRLDLTMSTEDLEASTRPTRVKTAVAFNSYTLSRQASDVRFVFPKRNLELWSTTGALEAVSPTLKTLFAGGMIDVKPKVNGKRRKSEGPSATAAPDVEDGDFGDSDDEGDDVYCGVEEQDEFTIVAEDQDSDAQEGSTEGNDKRTTKPNRELPEVEEGAVYQELKINTSAFTTYRAVLLWLASSHIDFAPLHSSYSSNLSSTRHSYLRTFHTSNPSLPIPSSPKSIFRLAHHLQLPELESLALASFSSQLTTSNLAEELFSPEAMRFKALRKVVVEAAAKQWASVKGSEGMKGVQERMKKDEELSLRFAKTMSELIMLI